MSVACAAARSRSSVARSRSRTCFFLLAAMAMATTSATTMMATMTQMTQDGMALSSRSVLSSAIPGVETPETAASAEAPPQLCQHPGQGAGDLHLAGADLRGDLRLGLLPEEAQVEDLPLPLGQRPHRRGQHDAGLRLAHRRVLVGEEVPHDS